MAERSPDAFSHDGSLSDADSLPDKEKSQLITNPVNAAAAFNLAPGSFGSLGSNIGTSPRPGHLWGDPEANMRSIMKAAYTPDNFAKTGDLPGIMLRIDNPFIDGHKTALDTVLDSTFTMGHANKYRLTTYKIRIPELHFMLPVPNNIQNPSKQDQLIIDCYPTVQAADADAQLKGVVPGDLVWVQIGNTGALTDLFYKGPLDEAGMAKWKKDYPHSPAADYGKLLEECTKVYSNAGAIGDVIGRRKNLPKLSTGGCPVVSGMGISENKVITPLEPEKYKTWVANLFRNFHKEDLYEGLIWAGICENNGPDDDVDMLSDEGKKVAPSERKPGRSTIIYMPMATDPKGPLEIIYWFHDSLGFANERKEWVDLWRAIKDMPKKDELTGERRNFVLVIPEMLWSKQGSDPITGLFRLRTDELPSKYKSTGSPKALSYQNRQWAAWGYDGYTFGQFGDAAAGGGTDYSLIRTPISYQPLPKDQTPVGTIGAYPDQDPNQKISGNWPKLYQEVIDLLNKHFGVTDPTNIKYLTLIANKKGGTAISNLARIDQLTSPKPSRIVLIHSDYSGINVLENNPFGGQPKWVPNWYHDNDLFQIVKSVDPEDPPQIEIHLAVKGQGADLPRWSFGSFLGATNALETGPNPDFALGVHKLKYFYENKLLSSIFLEDRFWWWKDIYPMAGPPVPSDPTFPSKSIRCLLQQLHCNGHSAVTSFNGSHSRLKNPFHNIIYKNWQQNDLLGAIAWRGPTVPVAITKEKTCAESEHTNTLIADEAIPDNIKKVFEDFDGKVILYSSELVGPSKTVAILQPEGASPLKEYELIYYFHGDTGLNGASKTYQPALKNALKAMIAEDRNVIVVLMDLDPHPMSASSKLWNNSNKPQSTFNNFHLEVLTQMWAKWQVSWSEHFGALEDSSFWKGLAPEPSKIASKYPNYDPITGEPNKGDDDELLEQKLADIQAWLAALEQAKSDFESQTLPNEVKLKDPAFFTIKAFAGGSRMLMHAIQNLDPQYKIVDGATGGLRRIDFLDANWGPEYGIINKIYNTWDNIIPGTNFEIQLVASSKIFGSQKISAIKRAEKYMPGEVHEKVGLWIINTDTAHGAVPYKYFAAPSKLKGVNFPTLPPPDKPLSAPIISYVTYDKDGLAYAPLGAPYYGKRLPNYDLKDSDIFIKGKLKNHTPSTKLVGQTRGCEVGSRETKNNTRDFASKPVQGEQNCKMNPLGLKEYKTSQFTNIEISQTKRKFSWATKEFSDFFKGLDRPMWAQTSPSTKWVVKDMSPQQANGVDKVKNYTSHREGIDADIVLPQLNMETLTPTPIGKPSSKRITPEELDVDKALAFILLSKLYGAKIIFLDKKFFKQLEDRAMFIATDGVSSGATGKILKMDPALKPFFKKYLFGKPKFVKRLMKLLHHKRGHESHFHVRIIRKWGSHETKDYPRWAINRLKKLGCAYQPT